MDRIATRTEEQTEVHRQQYDKLAQLIVDDLNAHGLNIRSLTELQRRGADYRKQVPVLVYWLENVKQEGMKETVLRLLERPWAKEAAPALIREFEKSNERLFGNRWVVGNALSFTADNSVAEDMFRLAKEKKYGRDREMLVFAFKNLKGNPEAVDVLIELLDDEDVCGHAINALRKLGAARALPFVRRFLNHPKTWIRNEAKKFTSKIETEKASTR